MSVLEQLVEKPKPPEPVSPSHGNDDYVEVMPYNAYQDPNCAHYGLTWFWDKLREHGLLKLYYPDLTDDDRLFPTFVRMLSSASPQVTLVLLKNSGEVKDLIGIATQDPLGFGKSALSHCGFIFRQEYWNRRISIEAGHRIMEHWFEAEPKLDAAVGLIAQANVLATRYVKALGWVESGWLHQAQQYEGKPCDALIFQYTREMYEKRGVQ